MLVRGHKILLSTPGSNDSDQNKWFTNSGAQFFKRKAVIPPGPAAQLFVVIDGC